MAEPTGFWGALPGALPGALALGGIAVLYWRLADRPLGVSGLFRRVLDWRHQRRREAAARRRAEDPGAVQDALRAATLEEFGAMEDDPEVATLLEQLRTETPGPAEVPGPVPPVAADALFLACVLLGSHLASRLDGSFTLRTGLEPGFAALLGGGVTGWVALVVGGVLVGLGTSLAGGCTSGHGLSGLGRLERGSMVATATFFSVAVVLSFLLAALGAP